jgi:membrane associated rhomboid family serine protease
MIQNESIITYILIGVTVIATFYAWNDEKVFSRWMFNPYDIRRKKQYFRFITSGLIHLDYVHLFFNMLSLYFFGPIVEASFKGLFGGLGILAYLLLYFLAMIVADLKSFFSHGNDHNYNSLGASGAVSAIIFSAILFYPTHTLRVYFIPMPGFLYAILFLIYSYYAGRNRWDNIGHDAHFYGAIFGIVFTIILWPQVVPFFFDQMANYRPSFLNL